MLLSNFMESELETGASPHRHSYYEFHFIAEGACNFVIEDKSCRVKVGSFLVSPPLSRHYFTSEKGIRQLIFCTASEGFRDWPALEKKFTDSIIHIKLDLSFEREYELIKRDSLSAIPDKQRGAFFTVLGLLLRNYDNPGSNRSSIVMKTQNELERRDMHRISIHKIADDLNVSHAYLIRLFKEETGLTPKQYMLKQRIDRSCHYLLSSAGTISGIAEKVGFQDPLYYSRIFKKIMGISPSEWRADMKVRINCITALPDREQS